MDRSLEHVAINGFLTQISRPVIVSVWNDITRLSNFNYSSIPPSLSAENAIYYI
jgi:hypothetical protein